MALRNVLSCNYNILHQALKCCFNKKKFALSIGSGSPHLFSHLTIAWNHYRQNETESKTRYRTRSVYRTECACEGYSYRYSEQVIGGLSGVEHLAGDKFHNDHGKRCLTFWTFMNWKWFHNIENIIKHWNIIIYNIWWNKNRF